MSANTMEDNYALSNKSRQRDRDVLAAANRAIVSTLYCSRNASVCPLRNRICKISTLSPRQGVRSDNATVSTWNYKTNPAEGLLIYD